MNITAFIIALAIALGYYFRKTREAKKLRCDKNKSEHK